MYAVVSAGAHAQTFPSEALGDSKEETVLHVYLPPNRQKSVKTLPSLEIVIT